MNKADYRTVGGYYFYFWNIFEKWNCKDFTLFYAFVMFKYFHKRLMIQLSGGEGNRIVHIRIIKL